MVKVADWIEVAVRVSKGDGDGKVEGEGVGDGEGGGYRDIDRDIYIPFGFCFSVCEAEGCQVQGVLLTCAGCNVVYHSACHLDIHRREMEIGLGEDREDINRCAECFTEWKNADIASSNIPVKSCR
jgi:hypothetical protein